MNEKEYKEIYKLCLKAKKIDCVPVGAIVMLNDKIIGKNQSCYSGESSKQNGKTVILL